MCIPPINIVENVIKYCAQEGNCAEVDGLNSAAVKAIIEEAKIGAEFKMCITGSKWLEMLSAFDIGLCATLLGIEYFPLIGKVELSKTIDVEIFSVCLFLGRIFLYLLRWRA
ncbi:hypothetical protein ANCCAN_20813 [Ancylostoma caninum]|uniref:Uncharacterized protein n=1 Tax=Ancylostoma caninum TaxID=29170 RepID=A0A368FME0_ANCCA|nr:hypothetical protein ANCCAN_20813 [Ancylostoma caninum]